jgi:hypothetical protein
MSTARRGLSSPRSAEVGASSWRDAYRFKQGTTVALSNSEDARGAVGTFFKKRKEET